MINSLIEKIGLLSGNLSIPLEIITVFTSVTDIWNAFPFALKGVLIGIMGISTFFCIMKMLFR